MVFGGVVMCFIDEGDLTVFQTNQKYCLTIFRPFFNRFDKSILELS